MIKEGGAFGNAGVSGHAVGGILSVGGGTDVTLEGAFIAYGNKLRFTKIFWISMFINNLKIMPIGTPSLLRHHRI